MEGKTATTHRPRNTAAKRQRYVTETFDKGQDAVLLHVNAIDELFRGEGITTHAARADALGYPSTSLFRAWKGFPAPSPLIAAIRRRWPDKKYEELFIDGPAMGERKVPANARANRAA
ncbi:hypothetical protein [Dactylosporangium salmoneum]